MTHDEVDRICDKLARAAKDARAKHKRNAELFGVGGSHQTQTWRLTTEAAALIRRLRDERDEARKTLIKTAVHLAAAISLLEKGGKAAKKAAPSDKMFDQMLKDYRSSLSRARAALKSQEPTT